MAAAQLSGCSPMRLLGPRQRLLTDVRLQGVRGLEREDLSELYRQRPNRRVPLPQLAIYNLGYTFYKPERIQAKLSAAQADFDARIKAAGTDSVAVGRLLQKRERRVQRLQDNLEKGNAVMNLGEPPVIYDSTLTAVTAEQIRLYFRSKGFFRARVSAQDTTRERRVTVTYRVQEGPRFRISHLDYDVADPVVAGLIRADSSHALLRRGQPYDEELIGQERARLETYLKNAGYYDFRAQYITLEADTSFAPTTVRLLVQVANPADQPGHQVYALRRVSFVTDAGLNRFGRERDTVRRNGVDYLAYNHRFSTRILERKLLIRPGERYSLERTVQTQRQLAGLDVFRYAAVTYQKPAGDSLRGRLDAVVNTTPLKRFDESTELGGTYVAGLPGPFGNVRLRVRNAFGGAEVLDIGLRAGLEGQFALASNSGPNPGTNARLSRLTTQLGGNVNLTLPQFLVPWRTNRFFTSYSPRTRLTGSYTYVDRQEYRRTNLEATYDYIWQRNAFHQFILTPVDVSLINSTLSPVFEARIRALDNGQALIRAFQSVLVPSVNATSIYNDNDFTQTRDARYLRLFAELGAPARRFYTNADRNIGKVPVYDFVRLNVDYRRYHKLSSSQFLVWRLNAGLATALTRSSTSDNNLAYIIPYDRYLFAGGGSSVRAWLPRRLGTGSHIPTLNPDSTDQSGLLEQPGEVLFEGSVEYRFPIYSFINGTVFTDFGNVWTLKRPGSQNPPGGDFTFRSFPRELAVGSGLGLRFDFTFLIVRLDFAAKVYDPTADGNRYVLPKLSLSRRAEYGVQPNIGIGYPF